MKKCANSRIRNPRLAEIINGEYKGITGWADCSPNAYGIVKFCNITGSCPYQYNAPIEKIKYLETGN